MLPAEHRMRRRADFATAVRAGRRASSPSLVLHVGRGPGADEPPTDDPVTGDSVTGDPARFGLIVSRSVGGSVVRHRVARRIRGVCASRLGDFGPGDLVVVRALPSAAEASSARLAADLDQAIERLRGRGRSDRSEAAS